MARRAKSSYTDTLARRICDLVAEGASLETVGELPDMPSRRLMRGWLEDHPDFERRYEIARRERTDNLVDEAISIADSVRGTDSNAAVGAAKLAVDTRRWLASKLLPERFGDRLELSGKDGAPLLPAADPEPGKVALAILTMLEGARRDAEPQPAIEHYEAPAEPVIKHLDLDPGPAPSLVLSGRSSGPAPSPAPGNRTLLNTFHADHERRQREAIDRERVRLRLVQLDDGQERSVRSRDPRGGR